MLPILHTVGMYNYTFKENCESRKALYHFYRNARGKANTIKSYQLHYLNFHTIYIYIYIYKDGCCRSKERIRIYFEIGRSTIKGMLYICLFPACCFSQRTCVAQCLFNGVLNKTWTTQNVSVNFYTKRDSQNLRIWISIFSFLEQSAGREKQTITLIYKNIIPLVYYETGDNGYVREKESVRQGTARIWYLQSFTSLFCLHEAGTGPTLNI